MTATLIDGKALAARLRRGLKRQIQAAGKKGRKAPKLAVILVGKDPASAIYVRNKHQACEEVGIESIDYSLPISVTQKKLTALIQQLNKDKSVHGILVQLPLPRHIKADEVLEQIHPLKDVDGFHSSNVGRSTQGRPQLRPCTPFGIMLLLEEIKFNPSGKEAVIVGASNIVGKPMAMELLAKGATITICHHLTKNLAAHIKRADLLVSAVGNPAFIKGSWIKKGAVVIDVGITPLANGKLAGDLEFEKARRQAAWLTPVPGGVGPMTVVGLLKNTLLARDLQTKP